MVSHTLPLVPKLPDLFLVCCSPPTTCSHQWPTPRPRLPGGKDQQPQERRRVTRMLSGRPSGASAREEASLWSPPEPTTRSRLGVSSTPPFDARVLPAN
jgi:hypothetical protein